MIKSKLRLFGWAVGLSLALGAVGAVAVQGAPVETKADYDELYSATFTDLDTYSYEQNKTFTLGSKSWTASVSQVNGGVFYLGCNSTHASKGILNNNSTFSDVVSALASAEKKYKDNQATAHAYALRFDNAYSKVTKIEFNWSGGNNAFQVFLFGDSGSGYVKLGYTDYASSGQSVSGSVSWTGTATNYTKLAVVARPGTTSTTATNKTIRPSTFKIYKDREIPVTGVSLDSESATIDVDDSLLLTATISPANATNKGVSWISSAPAVATVNNGLVEAVAPGTATITVKTDDGEFEASCLITVPGTPHETAINLIQAIPSPVVYSSECGIAIAEARSYYDSLGDDEKALVTNISVLVAAESTYYSAGAQYVDELIDLLGDIVSYSQKADVEFARAEYDSLPAPSKALVTKLSTLVKDEAKIQALTPITYDLVFGYGTPSNNAPSVVNNTELTQKGVSVPAGLVYSAAADAKVYLEADTLLKIGASKTAGAFTLSLANANEKILKVTVNAQAYGSDSVTLSVGGDDASSALTSSLADYVFEFASSSSVKSVEITRSGNTASNQRFYIHSISVECEDSIQTWINGNMKLDDSSFDGEGNGACKVLYASVKSNLLALGSSVVSIFQSNTSGKYTAALNRYLKWAAANTDSTPFANGGSQALNVAPGVFSNNSILAISLFVGIGALAVGGMVFLRKRKEF